jgi:hypothetical protein
MSDLLQAIVLMEQLTRLNVNLLQEYCAHA